MKRRLALSSLLAVSAFNANPAQAVTRQQMVDRIKQIGVTVVRRKICGTKENLAYYDRKNNLMCLSDSAYKSLKIFDQVLAHEAVHVIQDCHAGFDNSRQLSNAAYLRQKRGDVIGDQAVAFIQAASKKKYLEIVRTQYRPTSWDVEVEAYALMGQPNLVYGLLKTACM